MSTRELHFSETIKSWDEAIPLGNGDIGCLIWNSSDKLRFSLDKGGIWDCSNPPDAQENFTYADLKNLVYRKQQKKINKKYDDCYFNPTPTKLPAGKIILDLGVKENVVSHLSFDTAEAVLQAGSITVKSFVHANENYGLIFVSQKGIKVKIEHPQFGKKKKLHFNKLSKGTVQSLKNIHYDKAVFISEKEGDITYQYFIQPTYDNSYGIVLAQKESANGALIAYTVGIEKTGAFVPSSKLLLKNILSAGYENARTEHLKWWNEFWSKSKLEIPDKFLEKQWYFNNYLLASCSRKGKYPMPLQGVWTADNDSLPPWKGDYHHDLNTQMSYTSYLKANHVLEGESFIDYLLDMSEAGKQFSERFYGVEGLCLPSVMDIQGHALGGWCQYALSPTNQLWLCCIMARHYYYTRNQEQLVNQIYPYMCEVGKFLFNLLKEENGIYKLPLSTSPEIHDNSLSAWLTPNSNYDLALMKAFCDNMSKLSEIVGESTNAELWKKRLEKFDALAVNDKNVLMLSPDESLCESHRHHSHCMSIYPLRLLKYDTDRNKNIIDSTIRHLEKLGIKNWVGYSLGWMAELYAIQKNGDKAFEMLNMFYRYFCTDNGFHSNGDYRKKTECAQRCRLFTLEGNFLATDALQEMLLYSEADGIELFPALPGEWDSAAFSNFLAYGGAEVSAKLANGKIVFLELYATADVQITILNNGKYKTAIDLPEIVSLKKGQKVRFFNENEEG